MYQYLVGMAIAGFVWALFFVVRRDLRRTMLWGGLLYVALLSVGFVAYRLLFHDVTRSITPGYWSPPTLLELQSKTHGYGIEDALFMFFLAGSATCLYEICCHKKLESVDLKNPRIKAMLLVVLVSAIGSLVLYKLFYMNDIYLLIDSSLFAALAIWWMRRDLIVQSVVGGIFFVILYIAEFSVFTHIFSHFIANYYHLRATSGVLLLGIPLEEYLYGLAFGLFWTPLYRFIYGLQRAD